MADDALGRCIRAAKAAGALDVAASCVSILRSAFEAIVIRQSGAIDKLAEMATGAFQEHSQHARTNAPAYRFTARLAAQRRSVPT